MWTEEWGRSERQFLERGSGSSASFYFPEACHLAPPEGSGDVAVFTSRNHLCVVSRGA